MFKDFMVTEGKRLKYPNLKIDTEKKIFFFCTWSWFLPMFLSPSVLHKAWFMNKGAYCTPWSCNILDFRGGFRNQWAPKLLFYSWKYWEEGILKSIGACFQSALWEWSWISFLPFIRSYLLSLNKIPKTLGLRLVARMERRQLGREEKYSRRDMWRHQPSSKSTVIIFIFISG